MGDLFTNKVETPRGCLKRTHPSTRPFVAKIDPKPEIKPVYFKFVHDI